MFGFGEKKNTAPSYNPKEKTPAIRCSICTGEQVAGFKDVSTGSFSEVMVIRSQRDLDAFREKYNISGKIPKIY